MNVSALDHIVLNVAELYPERVEQMVERLVAHNTAQAQPAWPSLGELPINIDKTLITPDAPDDEYIYWAN